MSLHDLAISINSSLHLSISNILQQYVLPLTLVTAHEEGPPSFSSPENNQRSDPLQAPGEKDYHAGQNHEVDNQVEEGKLCYRYISGTLLWMMSKVVLVTMMIILMMIAMVTDRPHDFWRKG